MPERAEGEREAYPRGSAQPALGGARSLPSGHEGNPTTSAACAREGARSLACTLFQSRFRM